VRSRVGKGWQIFLQPQVTHREKKYPRIEVSDNLISFDGKKKKFEYTIKIFLKSLFSE